MAGQIPNVRTWSKTVPPHRFTPADLDVYLLKEHPALLAAMGRERTRAWGDLPDLPLVVATLIAPGVGIAGWFARPSRGRPDLGSASDDLAAWCFALALVGMGLIIRQWWRSGRRWTGLELAGTATTGAAGLLTLWLMGTVAEVDVLAVAPVSLPVWLAVLAAGAMGAAIGLGSRGRRAPFRRHFRAVAAADRSRIDAEVAALAPRRRETLAEERRRALGRLRRRGLLDETQQRALDAQPLGHSPLHEE